MSSKQDNSVKCLLLIKEKLNLSKREELIAKLEHLHGINFALFIYPKYKHLRIIYDPIHFSQITLLDTLKQHHVTAEIIN